MAKKKTLGVNPQKGSLTGEELARLASAAPQYYQYLMNPDGFDYNTLPTGTSWAKTGGKYSGWNIDYDSLRRQLKSVADAKAAEDAAAQAAIDAETKAKADALAKRTGDITNATSIADRQAAEIVKQWGLDPAQYDPQIDQTIAEIASTLGDSKDPYAALSGSDIATQLLNREQTTARNNYTRQANEKFGINYADKLLGGNVLDDAITEILGEQQSSAQQYLDRGMARGIYNDTGYSAGRNQLNNQATTGRSTLTSLADDVLEGYRTKANSVRDSAYGAASGYTLGSPINLDEYVSQGNAIRDKALSLGEGDLRSALGGQNFFDFSSLTNAAGAAQGATNLRDSSIASVLADREAKKRAGRGLGSQGAF